MSGGSALVVPCFDEAERFDAGRFTELARATGARLVLVDDGSTDATHDRLAAFATEHPHTAEVLALAANVGKGEAVRAGLRRAIDLGVDLVGYCDADLATPPDEVGRLFAVAGERTDVDVVLGSRVGLLGHDIHRSARRHYLGRVFATASSLVLGLQVYDTQCGAKVLRVTPALRRAVAEPFVSRWAFDVELLGRLLDGPPAARVEPGAMLEVPLTAWRDVDGSKLDVGSAVQAASDLVRIAAARRRSRTRASDSA